MCDCFDKSQEYQRKGEYLLNLSDGRKDLERSWLEKRNNTEKKHWIQKALKKARETWQIPSTKRLKLA